jgi:uncharacterized surface protein with fasciclin (FAS1) repeats
MMSDMRKTKRMIPAMLLAAGMLVIITLHSCKRDHLTLTTTSTVNMLTYLQQNADQYSLFTQIVEKAGYSSFLNAYGAYTLFVPTNDGVNAYLKKNNKASVNDIDVNTAKSLVSISIIQDTIATSLFTDGRIRTPTMLSQYLITGASNNNGVSTITVNKQANLIKGNLRFGNGIIHVIDNMLVPATLTLAQTVEQNPEYSIFTEALKATGFYDSLNVAPANNTVASRKYLTVIAQPNSVFAAAGIPDFATLKQRYSTTGNPKNSQDSLYLFVAYRVFPELAYLTDLATITSHSTLAPLEVATSELNGQDLLINNLVFNGVLEPGAPLNRNVSDISATNGVLHSVQTNYKIKVRIPGAVYFDLGDQPEIKRTPGLYRSGRYPSGVNFLLGQLADVTWIYAGGEGPSAVGYYFKYLTTGPVPSSSEYYYGNDYIQPGGRFRAGTNGMSSITFKTPLLVKGRYKVWVDYKRGTSTNPTFVSIDGVTLPNVVNVNDGINDAESDAVLEAKGYKRYSESPLTPGNSSGGGNGHIGRLAGTINIATTDRHNLTIFTPSSGGAAPISLDVVEFRPIDMPSQVYPKLGRDGTLKY